MTHSSAGPVTAAAYPLSGFGLVASLDRLCSWVACGHQMPSASCSKKRRIWVQWPFLLLVVLCLDICGAYDPENGFALGIYGPITKITQDDLAAVVPLVSAPRVSLSRIKARFLKARSLQCGFGQETPKF